jgi:hypothetical protein
MGTLPRILYWSAAIMIGAGGLHFLLRQGIRRTGISARLPAGAMAGAH